MKYLIIVAAGHTSLHRAWIVPDSQYDVLTIDYSKNSIHADCGSKYYLKGKGTKWHLVKQAIEKFNDIIRSYNFIWIPDDDIYINRENIIKLFETAQKYDLFLSQPALSRESYYSFKPTLKVPLIEARITNFVEIMAPLFRADALFLNTDIFSTNKSGWGIEYFYQEYSCKKKLKMGIIDKYHVTHTRPINVSQSVNKNIKKEGFYREYDISPHEDLALFLNKFKIDPKPLRVLKAFFRKNLKSPALYPRIMNKYF